MKNNIFAFAFLLLLTVGAWAQNLPGRPLLSTDQNYPYNTANSIWSSPQSTTTEGRYRSNTDNFIRPDQFSGVKFDKWFGMVSFLSDENNGAIATTGFATNVFSIYIGAFYSGNFWAGKPSNNFTEEEPAAVPNGGKGGKVYDVYNNINVGDEKNPVNNFAIIIGIGDMGFRLSYLTNYQSFKKENIVTGNQLYKNYKMETGYIAPQIAWAFAKDLTKNGIRPYATVDLAFNRDYEMTETSGPDTVTTPNPDDPSDPFITHNTGKKIKNSANHIDPSFSAGLGGYTFYTNGGFRLSADLDYVLTFFIYNNEYSYVENGEYKTGKINGTYTPGTTDFIEQSFVKNLVIPSLSGQWSKDRLALRFKLNFPLTFATLDKNEMALDSSNKLVYNEASKTTSTFLFRPDLRLAMQFKIVPDKLILNAGARIQATAITLDTILQKDYSMGKKISAKKEHNKTFLNTGTGTQFVSRFSIGPTFYFTENVWVEASTGVSNVYGEGAIDLFAPGGLFAFGSILVALKF